MLPELVEAYYSPNMGLITHLQYPVQREEEADEEPGRTTSLHLNSGLLVGSLPKIQTFNILYVSLSCRIQ